MDLIVTIMLVLIITSTKYISSSKSIIESNSIDNLGNISTDNVYEDNLVLGSNLMLLKEPRAYHKILDELGLS